MLARYAIRLLGPLDDAGLRSLQDLEVEVVTDGRLTLVSGVFDQPALHGLLERTRVHDLTLQDLRRVRSPR